MNLHKSLNDKRFWKAIGSIVVSLSIIFVVAAIVFLVISVEVFNVNPIASPVVEASDEPVEVVRRFYIEAVYIERFEEHWADITYIAMLPDRKLDPVRINHTPIDIFIDVPKDDYIYIEKTTKLKFGGKNKVDVHLHDITELQQKSKS